MTTGNKQIKVVTDVNFNHNKLINVDFDGVTIDANTNTITHGSSIKMSTDSTTLGKILNDKQDKLVAGKNITIEYKGKYWTDFGGEDHNNLRLVNTIPTFSSIKIIFKASCNDISSDDNALLCREDEKSYIGVKVEGKPSIWNNTWTEGQTAIEQGKIYWYCLNSTDGQTFKYYSLEDNNYTLITLPQLSNWQEQCTIEDNFFAEKDFYIGYNPVTLEESWKGNIYECQILINDSEWFNLSTAQEGTDFINNGCTYVGGLSFPVISATKNSYNSGFNIDIDSNNNINFNGFNYTVTFFPRGYEGEVVLFEDITITDSTLLFKNGQLLRNGEEYDYYSKLPAYTVNSIEDIDEDEDLPPVTYVIFKTVLQNDDKIVIVNGLNPKHYTGITGTTLEVDFNVNSNIIILKNGILLCGENSWSNQDGNNTITFGTPLNENDLITIIPNYNIRLMYPNVSSSDLEDGNTLPVPGGVLPSTLVWVETLLLTLNEDYEIIDNKKIKFLKHIDDNSFIQLSIATKNSIYNAIGDGLSTVSNQGSSDFDDGVYHPKNGDELNNIFENEPGLSRTIDFSNFDFSTFYRDGYTIDGKSFTIRNFSMSSNWGAWQFNWMKSPLFTLNNGATLYFQNLVINAENVHHDSQGGSEASNTAPLIKAYDGSHISITNGGMININDVTGIDKYVAIELNDSNIYIQNFGITINSYDENRPDNIDSLTCAIECNGFSYGENNFDRVGFNINGNTTEKYGIKYNDDLGGFIKINGGGFNVDGGNGYSIYCSNKTILELSFANVGKIDGMAITVKQLSPNTDYYKDDIIEIDNKLYQVTQDFNSNDYNNIEDGYGQVYEDFWTINVTGTMYSIEDPNGRISSYETTDGGYRAKGLTLDTENWNFPISDEHLTATNAQDAIKELAAVQGGGSGASLYDIKTIENTSVNSGWAYLCKTTRQDLSKNDVPTLYEDIKNKYNKTEIGSYNPAVDNNAHSIQYDVFSGKYYGFFPNPDDFNHLALCYSDTPDFSTKTFVLVNGNYVGEIMYFLGKNINLLPVYYQSLEVYDKNWNYIKTIPDMFPHNNYSPNKFVYDGSFRFVDGSDDNIGHFCKVITISDNVNADVSIRELTFSFNYAWFTPVNLGLRLIGEEKKPIYSIVVMSGGGAYVIDNIFGEVKVCYVDNAYGNCSRVFGGGAVFIDTPTGNVEYGLVDNMVFDSDYNLWYLPLDTTYNPNDHKIDSLGSDNSQIVLSGQALVGNPFINFDYVVTQQGVYNLEISDNTGHPLKVIPLSFGGNYGFWLGIVNDIFMFSGYMHNYYYRSDAQKEIYTDSYVIDGTTVNINYYKFNDWRICLANQNGTDDVNLDIVYNGIGYLDYWRLDLTQQQISLPRNSNLYTQMYIGDNYQDTNTGLPNGRYSAFALKSELQSSGSRYFKALNVSILSSDWISDTVSVPGYNYKCEIPCVGVTAQSIPEVYFSNADLQSGNYSSVYESGADIITIYSKVNDAITIPAILAF